VPGEVFRLLRCAATRQVLGRGDDHPTGVANVAGAQRAVWQVAKAQGHIGLTAENVGNLVTQRQVDQHLRVKGAECGHQRHHCLPAMAKRCADP